MRVALGRRLGPWVCIRICSPEGRESSKCGADPTEFMEPWQSLLPLVYRCHPVRVERNYPRVFYVGVAAGGGLFVCDRVAVPMVAVYASRPCLLPGQTCTNPHER